MKRLLADAYLCMFAVVLASVYLVGSEAWRPLKPLARSAAAWLADRAESLESFRSSLHE